MNFLLFLHLVEVRDVAFDKIFELPVCGVRGLRVGLVSVGPRDEHSR